MGPYNEREGRRRAFEMVPETCPLVKAAMETAREKVVEQTEMLREALIEVCIQVEDLEDKIKELEYELEQEKNRS